MGSSTQARYAGGAKTPAMASSVTDFDVIFVGGHNAAALAKFI
jgi:hypothetical protein